jgi:hypothetical protein
VRYQCFVENIPQKVIQCMYEFADDMTIQEIGLETFAVLAGAGNWNNCKTKTKLEWKSATDIVKCSIESCFCKISKIQTYCSLLM